MGVVGSAWTRGGIAGRDLDEAANLHAQKTEAMVRACFPKIAALPGFSCQSNVANEVRSAISQCVSNGSKCVALLEGTYRGAFCATLGSKTDNVLMANLGGGVLPRAYNDLFTVGVDVIEQFQRAGGRDMFREVRDDLVQCPEWRAAVAACKGVEEAAVREIEDAGLCAIQVLLSPHVAQCLRHVGIDMPGIQLDVHPSGVRGNDHKGNALRAGCEQIRSAIYAAENGCTSDDALLAVRGLLSQNKADVQEFCMVHQVNLDDAPASFHHCPLHVIQYAWTQLTAANMAHVFPTRLWLCLESVDELIKLTTHIRAQLGPDGFTQVYNSGLCNVLRDEDIASIVYAMLQTLDKQGFITASNGGLWAILRTPGGQLTVDTMLQTLDKQGFITASNGGLWAILRTPGGQLTVDKMLQTLDKQGFITASNGGLWAILRTPGGQRTVDKMLQTLDKQGFITASNGGLWATLQTPGGQLTVDKMLQTLGKQGFITASNNGLWATLQTPGGQLTVDTMLQTLDKQGFITASNGGLWAILQTPGGQLTVDTMLQTLGKQGFITASNNGLWATLRTPGGQLTVDTMLQTLDKQGFITASNGGLWAILRTPGGQRTVDTMMQYTGEHFLMMAKGGFWSQMLKNGIEFERCLREAVDTFGMSTIARIMATCASRFCDETYRSVLYEALALEPRDRMVGYCREYGAHLVKLQKFARFYAVTPSWTTQLGRALKAQVKPDRIAPLTEVTPDVWLRMHDPVSIGAHPAVLQAAAADEDDNGRDANVIPAYHLFNDMSDFEDAPPFRAAPSAEKVAKPKAKPADDDDFFDTDDAPKKAAPKPNAAKGGGAAVAEAAPKKAPAKANAKEESPDAVLFAKGLSELASP
jgi:predicted RNA binding protein YcfA (HicA-like mRNA interferase family)